MFALGMTSLSWHAELLANPPAGAVNFWTPTPWRINLSVGTRFGFMLKAPVRRIGGFGHFADYLEMTVEDAWQRWGASNGAESLREFKSRIVTITGKRSKKPLEGDNPIIGCIILDSCVFLPAEEQIQPALLSLKFPSQIVKWKGFEGELILPFEHALPDSNYPFRLVDEEPDWQTGRSKKRIAQGLFRRDVLEAYEQRCAITDTDCAEVLDAAHIQPFVGLASNHPQNGIALRRDIHRLFDAGLITISPDHRVIISPKLTASLYVELEGKLMRFPTTRSAMPSDDALDFHRREVFRRDPEQG